MREHKTIVARIDLPTACCSPEPQLALNYLRCSSSVYFVPRGGGGDQLSCAGKHELRFDVHERAAVVRLEPRDEAARQFTQSLPRRARDDTRVC